MGVQPTGLRGPGVAGAGLPPNQRRLIVYVVVAIIAIVLVRGLFFHENKYEKIADGVTKALQSNDLAGAQKYFNAESATKMDRGEVGRVADDLVPLGSLKKIKEITPADAPARGHEFTVTFAKGTVDEKIRFDPDDKIVFFKHTVAKDR